MRAIEDKLTLVLLRWMRSRRCLSAEVNPETAASRAKGASGLHQREVHFDDFEAVNRLKTRLGLSGDSLENWLRLWRDNPALSFASSPIPLGWVYEVDDKIVGYLGNVPLLCHYGAKPLLAATASGFAVEPAYRAFSIGLVASFYRQKNIDLFLNTTAIESVGKLAKAFRAEALPQGDYDTVLFWVVDARAFVDVVMKKLGVTGKIRGVAGMLGCLVLWVENAFRRRRPRRRLSGLQITESSVSEIGAEFDSLWRRKLAENERPRLLTDRDVLQLCWHFRAPRSQLSTRVLRCERQGDLIGYAIVRVRTKQGNGLRSCELADMLAMDDNPAAIQGLLAGAYDFAKASGCHVLEVLGFPKNLRRALLVSGPYARKYPACPFYFKARDPVLHASLRNEDSWYACPFDGDTTLMP